MKLNLKTDAAELRNMFADAVKKYVDRHRKRALAAKYAPVTRIDLNYWLSDGGSAAPFVLLHLGTQEGSEPNGTWSHPQFARLMRPGWKPALKAMLDGRQTVEVTFPGGKVRKLRAGNLEKSFGEFLVAVITDAAKKGVFAELPKGSRCELGVEESGGSFGWPRYADRGKKNLA